MPLAQARHERLGKAAALAVFASDPLSSVAYATEEILFVLVLAGSLALSYSLPIAVGIAILLAIVVVSYRQTVQAYPQGGGAYLVSKDNLGEMPALIVAASLLIDYVLTVAVSIAAGVAAITSAVPQWHVYRVEMTLAFVAVLMLGNLRGIRESGRIFSVPTYFFIVATLFLIVVGVWRTFAGTIYPIAASQPATARWTPPSTDPAVPLSSLFSISMRSRLTAADNSSLRDGASPSQKGRFGGAPFASATRTVPAPTWRICHDALPSWKMSPAALSMAKSSLSVPMKVSSPSRMRR